VLVIDPNTYGASKVYSVGTVPDIPGAFDAATAAGYAYVAGRDPLTGRVTVTVIGPKAADTPAEPVQVDASYSRLGFGPAYVQGLWANVADNATGVNDGVLVQTVRGTDGLTRAIAYIGGTTNNWSLDPAVNQGIFENALSRAGGVKADQVAAIRAQIDRCQASPSCGPVEEVLLVGYSQGGMDAQNIAFWNALETPVAGVLTFGSPIIAINPLVTSLHIQDSLDGVVNLVQNVPAVALPINPVTLALLQGPLASALLRGEVYAGRSGTPVESLSPIGPGSVHSNQNTYRTLSEWFTDSPDSQYATQKTVVSRFLGGTLIGQWPPTPALFSNAV
jgi:hypothetical protein